MARTIPSSYPRGALGGRRPVSTPSPSRGLARDCRRRDADGFPDFDAFSTVGFPAGTIEVRCSATELRAHSITERGTNSVLNLTALSSTPCSDSPFNPAARQLKVTVSMVRAAGVEPELVFARRIFAPAATFAATFPHERKDVFVVYPFTLDPRTLRNSVQNTSFVLRHAPRFNRGQDLSEKSPGNRSLRPTHMLHQTCRLTARP